jgi:glycine cleavage system H protein
MSIPQHLKYAVSHEWCSSNEDGSFSIGITHHAQDALGDIVFIELPKVGQLVKAKSTCAVVESVKAASDIYALAQSPESINSQPYESWFFKIKASQPEELADLFDSSAYGASIGE